MKKYQILVPMISLFLLLLACQTLTSVSVTPIKTDESISPSEQSAPQMISTEKSYPPDDGSRIPVEITESYKYGYINRFGQIVIPPIYLRVRKRIISVIG